MIDALPIVDVQAIIRHLGALSVHPGGIADKGRTLLTGLTEIIHADGWWWVRSAVRDGKAFMFSFLDGGWTSENQRHLATTVHYTPGIEQTNAHFHPFLERGESVTRSRGQIIPDAEGLKSPAYLAHFEPVGINDFMCM
ncbi:MAG TPA: hypothetical protein VHM90_13385 [Phycisphaerae bacterium]|nr:hypothetical protein [Phycisphaerae bacterium]